MILSNLRMLSLIVVLGVVLCIIATSCNKGIDEERLLTDEMKKQNPYQVDNKIQFLSDAGEEYNLEVVERENEYHEFQNGNYATNYLIEIEKTSINSTDTVHDIYFGLEMSTLPRYELKIWFQPPYKQGMTATFKLPLSNDLPEYTDSVYINGKWQHNIYIEEIQKKDSSAFRLYYSTEEGVIKVDFSDDSFIILDELN